MFGWFEVLDVWNWVERGYFGYKVICEVSCVGYYFVVFMIGEFGKWRFCWCLLFLVVEGILFKYICKSLKFIYKMIVKFFKVLWKKNEEDFCFFECGSVDEEDYLVFR